MGLHSVHPIPAQVPQVPQLPLQRVLLHRTEAQDPPHVLHGGVALHLAQCEAGLGEHKEARDLVAEPLVLAALLHREGPNLGSKEKGGKNSGLDNPALEPQRQARVHHLFLDLAPQVARSLQSLALVSARAAIFVDPAAQEPDGRLHNDAKLLVQVLRLQLRVVAAHVASDHPLGLPVVDRLAVQAQNVHQRLFGVLGIWDQTNGGGVVSKAQQLENHLHEVRLTASRNGQRGDGRGQNRDTDEVLEQGGEGAVVVDVVNHAARGAAFP
mmetsp:Transcript_73708/g.208755  ORF Transcript_73708/g.208755 Transcript_73708/m.208755 type:complete len:269 (-) Transcript_73708:2885-3691(-)